ncbi:HTH domain-containing protein [Vagococcus fluvialis]
MIEILEEVFILINILEDKIRRRIEMIDILSALEREIPIENLANSLEVSKSTIQRDIDSLNENFSELIDIQLESNNVSLKKQNSEKLYYLQYNLLNESTNIKLLTEILIHPFFKVKEYADKLNASSSNIYKMIKRINMSLLPYQIEVVKVNNKYFIQTASEITLRRLFAIYWAELNSFNCQQLTKHDKEFESLKRDLQLDIYETIKLTQIYYYSFLYISLIRENQKFYLCDTNPEYNNNDFYFKQERILSSLSYSPFSNNPLFNSRKLTNLKEFLNSSYNNHKDADLLFKFIQIIYTNEISDQIPIHVFISKYRSFYISLKRHSHLYYPVKEMINHISNILKVDLDNYEVLISYVLVVYFPDFLELNDKKTVYIYSKLSTSHAEFLQNQLETKFDTVYNFIVVKNKYFINENKNKYLYITNDKSIELDNNFVINDYPKRIDLLNLEQKLSNFHYPESNKI